MPSTFVPVKQVLFVPVKQVKCQVVREEEFVFGALERVNMRERSWVSTYRNQVLQHLGVLSREVPLYLPCYYHVTCLASTTVQMLAFFFVADACADARVHEGHLSFGLSVQTCKY
jgi:hypothetical protein